MLVLGHTAIGASRRASHALLLQGQKRIAHSILGQAHHRVPIVFLVACVHQRVERKRVVVGSGNVFFDQGTQNASFNIAKVQLHFAHQN